MNLSKHLTEILFHLLILIFLYFGQGDLSAKVYIGYLVISLILVNVLSAEFLWKIPNIEGWLKLVYGAIMDILTFIFSVYLAYGTSLLTSVFKFFAGVNLLNVQVFLRI